MLLILALLFVLILFGAGFAIHLLWIAAVEDRDVVAIRSLDLLENRAMIRHLSVLLLGRVQPGVEVRPSRSIANTAISAKAQPDCPRTPGR